MGIQLNTLELRWARPWSEEQASIVYKTLAVDKEVNKLNNLLTETHLSAFMNLVICFAYNL